MTTSITSNLLKNIKKKSIQIVSDIHLEFYKDNEYPIINRHAPFLAICGDISPIEQKRYKEFLEIQSKKFDKVFIIIGNHEYYSKRYSMDQLLQKSRDICESFDNVFLLDRNYYNITEKTTIIGCSLWSNIDDYSIYKINDFNNILVFPKKNNFLSNKKINIHLTKELYLQYHNQDVEYLTTQIDFLQKENKDIIILTHHAPHLIMGGKYYGNKIASAFATNLSHLFKPPVIALASGHVHSNVDTKINNIRCVSNCIGYKDEDTGYKENTIIYFK